MSIGKTEWPHLLADLTAKRDALNQVIEVISTQFIREGVADVEESPMRARTSGRKAKATKARSKAPTRRADVHTTRAGMAAPVSSDVVSARDAAILGALKKGPKTSSALIEALPIEAGQTDEQRLRACSNGLTRLRLKGHVKAGSDGQWELR